MTLGQPPVEESANSRAYRRILDDIISGSLPDGTMLSEAVVAADLGMSRTPVRAALVRLQEEGWVTIYPKRGALVQTLNEREVAELALTKALLETDGVRIAPVDARAALVAHQRATIPRQLEALEARDLPAFVELSVSFHRAFVQASGNGVLIELYDRLADRQRFLLYSHGDRLFERAAEIVDEHVAMLDAIEAADDKTFASTLHEHLVETYGDPVRSNPF